MTIEKNPLAVKSGDILRDEKEIERREKHFMDLLSKYNKAQKRIKELEEAIEKLKWSELSGNESYFIDAKRELYSHLKK